MEYTLYVVDTETTGLDNRLNDVVELSLIRLSDGSQKTWHIKPLNPDTAHPNALRVNGLKLEDLKHLTKFGRETYRESSEVLVEIENWVQEDGSPSEKRILVGHNVNFDKEFLFQLWIKNNAKETFPFSEKRSLDTMQIEVFLDYCKDVMADGYSLHNLVKKYGIKNEKAHSAEADTKATREVFDKQVEFFRKTLKTTNA